MPIPAALFGSNATADPHDYAAAVQVIDSAVVHDPIGSTINRASSRLRSRPSRPCLAVSDAYPQVLESASSSGFGSSSWVKAASRVTNRHPFKPRIVLWPTRALAIEFRNGVVHSVGPKL